MSPAQPKSAGETASLIAQLYAQSKAESYGISREQFPAILRSVADRYAAGASDIELRALYASLHVEELALARACAAGNNAAWEIFLTRYREKLYDAAHAITHDDATARELADSIYAELYGTRTREGGERVSKLESYTGRGSLEGWLRTVLAQEYVNRYRAGRRNVSLEEREEGGLQLPAPAREETPLPDPRLDAAIDGALAGLEAEERFILAAYYLDGRTLAQVARMLGVHESTISRKLEKVAGALRKKVLENLVRAGMSRRQAEEALDVDVRDVSADIRSRLAQETGGRPFLNKESP
ncbi:MAG TPA: sigma-70 family RNA polymerase sigma factor [Terriglobales bacterium]|nr:sigma-70 family RNA polymerase sigma factor [Terriglobales bacterium]